MITVIAIAMDTFSTNLIRVLVTLGSITDAKTFTVS